MVSPSFLLHAIFGRNEVSLSVFAFLFAEVVEYCLKKVGLACGEDPEDLGRCSTEVVDLRNSKNKGDDQKPAQLYNLVRIGDISRLTPFSQRYATDTGP